MPYTTDDEGVLVIHFGTGDVVAATGTWDDRNGWAGLVLAQLPEPVEPGRITRGRPGEGEGQLGEKTLVRIVFRHRYAVDQMMLALEDLRETFEPPA